MRFNALFLFFIFACSSTPKEIHPIDEVMVSQIKIRRPPQASADPKSGPGGLDYQSNPLPDQRFDCRSPQVLLSGIQLDALRSCLVSLNDQAKKETLQFEYRLMRETMPRLFLQEELTAEKPASCLKRLLPEISVPREIFFQTRKKQYSCFNAGIDLEKGEVLGVGLGGGLSLVLTFPMQNLPKSENDMRRLLLTWALTPFFTEDDPRQVLSRVVPDSICKKCFGKTPLKREEKENEPVLFWKVN